MKGVFHMDTPEKPKENESEKAAVTLPGTVQKIIPPSVADNKEKAEIVIEGADPLYQEIRVDNALQDKNTGEEVALKPGAEVDVTIEAEPNATTPKKPLRKAG
jgi:hypothetical protein